MFRLKNTALRGSETGESGSNSCGDDDDEVELAWSAPPAVLPALAELPAEAEPPPRTDEAYFAFTEHPWVAVQHAQRLLRYLSQLVEECQVCVCGVGGVPPSLQVVQGSGGGGGSGTLRALSTGGASRTRSYTVGMEACLLRCKSGSSPHAHPRRRPTGRRRPSLLRPLRCSTSACRTPLRTPPPGKALTSRCSCSCQRSRWVGLRVCRMMHPLGVQGLLRRPRCSCSCQRSTGGWGAAVGC